MPRIPEAIIDEVRDRTDLVAVIGEHVQLKRSGALWKGPCPFHRDKDPSFYVYPDKHFFKCYGCGKAGDAIKFVMELQGKGFLETVRELALRAGIEVQEEAEDPAQRARRDERHRFLEINAGAAGFYRETLLGAAGGVAREYLASRGVGDEVAATFRLGYAPEGWDGLARWIETKLGKAHLSEAVAVGLLAARESGKGHYDRFRHRLMCPVIPPAGEVVAFSGRTLGGDPDAPKYVNSPASPVYVKGNVLFGLHAARAAFRHRGRAVIVEGNFDVIALHQAGFAETVAPLGTALTERQVDALRLLTPLVVLCLDGDAAGRAAALKHLGPLLEAGVETRVALLPDGEDPDSFVRKQGPAALEKLLGAARPAEEYFIYSVWGRSDLASADRRAATIREAASMLARIKDETKRTILVGELATALDVPEAVIRRAIQSAPPPAAARRPAGQPPRGPGDRAPSGPPSEAQGGPWDGPGPWEGPPPPEPDPDEWSEGPPLPPPPAAERKLMSILCDHPGLMAVAEEQDVGSLLTDGRLRAMYSAAREGGRLVDGLPTGAGEEVVREILSGSFLSLPDPARTLVESARTLRAERLLVEVEELGRQIKEAERRGDSNLARELFQRKVETRARADALRRRTEDRPR